MKAMGGIGTRWGIRGVNIWGDNGETRPREGEHTFQRKLTCATIWGKQRETRGDKRTHHPTQAHICGKTVGDNGRQERTQHLTQAHMWETMEHKRREGETNLGKTDTPSNTGTPVRRHERQASNTNSHVGRHWETRGGKTSGKRIHHLWRGSERQPSRHTCGEKMGDRRKQDLGKVDQHRHACGKNGR